MADMGPEAGLPNRLNLLHKGLKSLEGYFSLSLSQHKQTNTQSEGEHLCVEGVKGRIW